MCPDARLLSAYHDDEVPDPWKTRIEAHLNECPACQATLGAIRRQSQLLRSDGGFPVAFGHREDRFWQKLGESRMGSVTRIRRISVPVPLVAAAAVVLVLVGTINFLPLGSRSAPVNLLPSAPAVVSLTLEPQELETLLAFLEESGQSGSASDQVWALPVELPLARYGDPQLVRTADLEGGP